MLSFLTWATLLSHLPDGPEGVRLPPQLALDAGGHHRLLFKGSALKRWNICQRSMADALKNLILSGSRSIDGVPHLHE